jgi:GntR family transcriptional repressor for pyruvate dehydrogenase complex
VSEAASFVAIERQSVVALVIEQIRGLIASGALQPGQRLPSERALSELFGVSRPSVREAIRALGFMGILEIRQGSGTYVASANSESVGDALASLVQTSRETLTHLMEVRIWLEVGGVELAAKRISDEQLAELAEIVKSLRASVDDVHRFVEGDIAFHRVIHEASGNPILASLMLTVSTLGKQSRLITAQQLRVRKSTLREHEHILEALRNHDAIAARRAMREHLKRIAPHLADAFPPGS